MSMLGVVGRLSLLYGELLSLRWSQNRYMLTLTVLVWCLVMYMASHEGTRKPERLFQSACDGRIGYLKGCDASS